MRTTVKRIAGVTAACVVCATPAAFAVASADAASATRTKPPRPAGTSYVAPTANGAVSLVTSSDLHQVRSALFAYKMTCSDGSTQYDYDAYDAIPIGANRQFNYQYDSGPQANPKTPGAMFAYTESFSGMLNKAGTKIIGTARSTLAFTDPAGATVTCDTGAVKFIAKD